VIQTNPNWIGHLGLPQIYSLIEGFNEIEKKKQEAVEKAQEPTRYGQGPGRTRGIPGGQIRRGAIDSVQELRNLPGVKKVKRK
jgi:hypothetical protein